MSTLYPTIVLGIGTFGGNIVNLLRTLIYEELDQPGLPIFRFAQISSHTENEFNPQPSNNESDHAWEMMHVIRCTQAAEDTERIRHILQRERSDSVKDGIQEQGWKNWMDESLLNISVQTYEKGAGNNRMIGRCLLWNNWRRKAMVQSKLMNFIQEITNDVEVVRKTNDIMYRYHHRKLGEPETREINYVHSQPRVYLVGSMCGGTGSGMFTDLAYFFRALASQGLKIFGTFAVPDTITCNEPSRERLAANALAGLIELDYYMTDGTSYAERFPLENRPTESREKPFDFVNLISPRSIKGQTLGRAPVPNDTTLDELANIAAGSLFFEMLGGTEMRKAAIHVDFGARQDEWMTPKPDDTGFLRGFSTFGAATAHYPKYRIAGAAACKIVQEKMMAWIGRVNKKDPTTGKVSETRKEHDGLPAKEIAKKWFQMAWSRARERFCMGAAGTQSIRDEWQSDFNSIFLRRTTPKESDFRTLRDQMRLAPQGDPLNNRFVAGGRYAKLLESRLGSLRESMVDIIKEQYSRALDHIFSDDAVIPSDLPQNMDHLKDVLASLSGEIISEQMNSSPVVPTQTVSLSSLDNIFKEYEQAEKSAATWMLGARSAVSEYYRRLILNQYQTLLDKAGRTLEIAFLGKTLPELKEELERSIRNVNTRSINTIGNCIKYLQDHYRMLTTILKYDNLLLVVADRAKGIELDVEQCREKFLVNMWAEIFSEFQQFDKGSRSFKNQLIDPRVNYKQILTQMIDLMVRKLMGRMEGQQPFNIIDTLLSNYRLEVGTLAKGSVVLLELTPTYTDMFAGNHPRMICGGDPNEVGRLISVLNQEDLHDFDSAKRLGSSVNHMLHLYQEQAGMAIDDLLAYKDMLKHYNVYMRMGPEAGAETRILHTDRNISKYDKRIFRRIAGLKYSRDSKPSPFMIATEFFPDIFFSERPLSPGKIEAVFGWNDQGIERDEVYDPDAPEVFLMSIAHSDVACSYFKSRVQDLLEEMDELERVQRVNDIRSKLVDKFGRQNQRVSAFEQTFNSEFTQLIEFPWW